VSPAQLAIAPSLPATRTEFAALLDRIHALGRDLIAPAAVEVDRDARFPIEAFAALKAEKLLSAYIPLEFGGMGLTIAQVARVCEVLGQYCASTAMIFAMHQIQVACIVHHGLGATFFRDYARELVARQNLLASATTELGIGGDVRSSLVLGLVRKDDCLLRRLSEWDTLGFRGTCSPGFELKSIGRAEQIFPEAYARIHARTQHPVAHLLWSSLWVGLAGDALNRARSAVKAEARKSPGAIPISATRLAEADLVLGLMKCSVSATLEAYAGLLADPEFEPTLAFSIGVNNLKLTCSQQVLEVVMKAMLICGIAGYRNDSKLTLGRHLRDATGAALMVNNDRILGQNATMHVGLREA